MTLTASSTVRKKNLGEQVLRQENWTRTPANRKAARKWKKKQEQLASAALHD